MKGESMTAEQVDRIQEPEAVPGGLPRHDEKLIAERDWVRCAVVRFVQDVETAAPFDEAPTRHRAGDRMRLWQCGRKGRPVDRRFWHTSLDIDTLHFIPAEAVEVIEIFEDTPPSGPAPLHVSPTVRRWQDTRPNLHAS
jgi:hypothetical protein